MHGERSLLHRFGRFFSSRFQRGAWPLSAIRGWLLSFSDDDLERSSCNHQPSGAHPPLILVAKRAADHASTTQASPKSVPARGHADARMSATTDMARMRIGGAEGMMKAAAIDMAERAPRPALSEGTIQALPRLRAACAKTPRSSSSACSGRAPAEPIPRQATLTSLPCSTSTIPCSFINT